MNNDTPDWEWRYVIAAPFVLIALNFAVLPLLLIKRLDPLNVGLIGVFVSGLGAILFTWWLLCRRRGKPLASLGLNLPARRGDLLAMPFAGFLASYAMLLLAQSINREIFGEPEKQAVVEAVANVKNPGMLALWYLGAAVVGPVAEEIVFRGVLFRAIRHRWGLFSGLGISSMLFSLAHLEPQIALPILGLGVIFGLMTELSGSILPSILLHAAYNSIAFMLARHA